LLAEADFMAGDVDQAAARFVEAAAFAAMVPNADMHVLSGAELAVLAMDRGAWEEAAERVTFVRATIDGKTYGGLMLAGGSYASRFGGSVLRPVGLEHWITDSRATYVDRAVGASPPERRTRSRSKERLHALFARMTACAR
jgi:hypothetical protein